MTKNTTSAQSKDRTAEEVKATAMRLLATKTVEQLVEVYEGLYSGMDPKKYSPEQRLVTATALDLVMDELTNRDPERANSWLDSDEDSPRAFFIE